MIKKYGFHILYTILIVIIAIIAYTILSNILFNKEDLTLELNVSNNTYKIDTSNHPLASLYTEPTVYTHSECSATFSREHAMVIGDSIAEGLTAYGVIDEQNVIHVRGRTIQYMTADLDKAIQYQPKMLFLTYGANDLLSWQGNVDGYINAYKNSIDYIRKVLPNTKIYINSLLPVSDESKAGNKNFTYDDLFNERLKQFCEDENIVYIDNRDILQKSPDGIPYEPDGIHPRPFFYRMWASNMINNM